MNGLFGRQLEHVDGETIEPAPVEVARVLADAPPREPLPPLEGAGPRAGIVLFDRRDDGAVRYGRGAPELGPIASAALEREAALEALAQVALTLGDLHAAGECHGDLTADAIRVLPRPASAPGPAAAVTILMPAARLPAGALLRARLSAGAPPASVAFAAPEVVTGYEATPASDVYALAAIVHEVMTGYAPLGQIDFHEAMTGQLARLAALVQRGLSASPLGRPSAREIAGALDEAAVASRSLAQRAQAGPYRGAPIAASAPARSPAEAADRQGRASSMSGILVALLGLGGLFVFSGAVWLVGVTWGALDSGGRTFLMIALTAAVLSAGAVLGGRGYPRSGRAVLVLGVELLWADGAYLLSNADRMDDTGSWAALAGVMVLVAYVLAGVLDSLLFAVLSSLHFAVFAALLGAAFRGGARTGPATYALAVAVASAALGLVGHLWRRDRIGGPFAALAALAAVTSALAGTVLLDEPGPQAFAASWPYLVAAIAIAGALALPGRYPVVAAVVAGTVLAMSPTLAALMQHDAPRYLFAAVATGFVTIGAAFVWPRLARSPAIQGAWVLVGLASAVVSPSILFLVKCYDKDGLEALRDPAGLYLVLLIVVSAALVGGSFGLGRRALRKGTYRLLELAGLAAIFGAFTIESLFRYRDTFYPLVLFGLGGACIAVGAVTRRAALVVLACGALVLNLWIQYFVRLWDALPASLLVVGFGVALLVGGVYYERRLRHLLPGLSEWD